VREIVAALRCLEAEAVMSGGHNDNPALFAIATLGKLSGRIAHGAAQAQHREGLGLPLAANPLNRRELPAAFQALGAAAVAQLPIGRRWLAEWRDDAERLASRTPRVRVALRQLKQWYRRLDQLQERKSRDRERALCQAARSVLVAGRPGILRHHFNLFRGQWAARTWSRANSHICATV
jgi:hypothetical protein